MAEILGPKWEQDFGYNPNLIGELWAVDYDGNMLDDTPVVRVAVVDAPTEIAPQWASPFEQAGVHSRIPALTALLQSGTLLMTVDSLKTNGTGVAIGKLQEKMNDFRESLDQFKGRSDLTKLNSTQIFVGMNPMKINLTCWLKAFKSTAEVEDALAQLRAWASPKKLAKDGLLANAIKTMRGQSSDPQVSNVVAASFPSIAPTPVAFRFGVRVFFPMVIESLSENLASPRYVDGTFVASQFQLTLGSLTALDADDMAAAHSRRYTGTAVDPTPRYR